MELYNRLCTITKQENVMKDEPMKKHTTFRIGGPADYFVTPESREEIQAIVELCKKEEIPYSVIGNGSNLLVGDKGYRGVILQIFKKMNQIRVEKNKIYAGAGALLSKVAATALSESLTGFEFAAGIPGTLGGAVRMNAGAYGGEMKQVLESVEVMTADGEFLTIPVEEMGLAYRTSVVEQKNYIVLEAVISLEKGNPEKIKEVMDDLKEKRVTKQPLEYASAGSTFKRPEGYFAGKLIEDAGLRGFRVGDAQVSEKHCGFVINRGNASAAEVMELKANPNRAARGLVIEAELDKGKGPVATILVQKGTLRVGDNVTAGPCYGKVRAMMDDKGNRVKEAGPSTPVEILGLGDVPNAGEILMSFESDKEAKNFAGAFVTENKSRLLEETKGKLSLDNLFDQIQASDLKELPIIVKADVQGSVEAVKQSLTKLSNEEVVVRVIHGGVGAVNESDVSLAATSNAIIIGFNVRPDAMAKQLADQEGVDLRLYRVIYQAIEDVEAAMKGMLDPVFEEKVIGHAEVRQLFKASGVGTIAGSYILDGIFQRNCKVRITREGDQIFEGELASLKRFKDDVKEVKAGYECGLVFDGFNDVKEEDKVEAYIMVEVPR